MLAPAGKGVGVQLQGVSADPLTRQQQVARFAVADQAHNRGARMGLEGSPHLAHHLPSPIENHHPGAGELLWRHRAQELGADHHQVGQRACWLRGSRRNSLGGSAAKRW